MKTSRSAELLWKCDCALHKCKWQDSRGSLCFILTNPSLPDLFYIPLNILKRGTKRSIRAWCCPSLNIHHSSPSHPVHTGVGFSLGVQQRHRGPNKETPLLSTDVYVLLFWHCFPCGVKAYKGFLLHTLLANGIKAFGDSCLSPRVCTSIKRSKLQHVEAHARYHLSSGEGRSHSAARRVWRWHLFVWQIQVVREFIISACLVPLPRIKYLPWYILPNVGKIFIPNNLLNIDDTKPICSFPKETFSQQMKLMAQKLQTSFSVCFFAAPSSVLLNLYTLLKGTFLPRNCPASLLWSVSRLHLVIQPCDMIYVLTVTSRPNNQPRQDTSETDEKLPTVLHSGFFHPFLLRIFIYFWLDFFFSMLFCGLPVSAHRRESNCWQAYCMFNSISAAGTTPPSASC